MKRAQMYRQGVNKTPPKTTKKVKYRWKLDHALHRSWLRLWRRCFRLVKNKRIQRRLRPLARLTVRHYRLSSLFLVLVFVAGTLAPLLSLYITNHSYDLTPQTRALLGNANAHLAEKLTFDPAQNLYQFNKDAKKTAATDANPIAQLKSQVGGGGKDDEQLHSVDIHRTINEGVTYYDNQMQLSFKITPQFKTRPGEKKEGHLIYPLLGTKGQLAYTVTTGGLKENLILHESPGNDFAMHYTLDLPDSLEAKLLPSGEVGVYSADPALFGQITYGTSDDQARVAAARTQSPKTHLAFVIPAPVVLGVSGDQSIATNIESKFDLKDSMLTVITTGLDDASYPLSIDPTVSITSNSDFQAGNFEDNNLYVEDPGIHRGFRSGGGLADWSGTSSFNYARWEAASVAYNGYLYIMGGNKSAGQNNANCRGPSDGSQIHCNDVQYAKINTDGTIGSWTTSSHYFENPRRALATVVYNGYLYVMGGEKVFSGTGCRDDSVSDGECNDVQYAKINTDGSITAWQYTNYFSFPRRALKAAAYNGYMYITGGYKSSASTDCRTSGSNVRCGDVQRAAINANGTLGSWSHVNYFSTPRAWHEMAVYSGYMYVLGGHDGSSLNSVEYAKINSDGSLSSWMATTNLPSANSSLTAQIAHGYIYIMGGGAPITTVSYAPVYANGRIGTWKEAASFATARYNHMSAFYNVEGTGYLYILGGDNGSSTSLNDVQYTYQYTMGVRSNNATTTSFTTARSGHASVAYNGYLYVAGGVKSSSSSACRNSGSALYCNDVQYAAINANGTLGSWSTTSYFGTPRHNHTLVAYNNYMYIMGGYTTGGVSNVQYATINANGTLGSWSNTQTLPAARGYHASVAYNGYMYTLGGYIASWSNTVIYAPINANGTLGSWSSTTSFTTGRDDLAAVAYGGFMYIMGGATASGVATNTVQYAPINTNGTVGAWSNATSFTTARWGLTAFAHNGYMYIMGGEKPSSNSDCRNSGSGIYCNDIQHISIDEDGSLGGANWSYIGTFGTARVDHGTAVYNGNYYVTGGNTGSPANDVVYASINNNGGGHADAYSATTSITASTFTASVVAHNGFMYILGGYDESENAVATVQYAPVNADGTLGSWTNTTSLPSARGGAGTTVYNGYVYVGGGYGTSYMNAVVYAKINTDGTLGSWSTATSFSGTREGGTLAAHNGYLYVSGGWGYDGVSWDGFNDVQYTPISSNGSLGSWTATSSFTTRRASPGIEIYNGYIYVSGGQSSDWATGYTDVQYAKINSNGTVGTWAYTTSLERGRHGHKMKAENGYMYVTGGFSESPYWTNNNFTHYAPINANGTLGNWVRTVNFSVERRQHSQAIYNGYLYIIGGEKTASNTSCRSSGSGYSCNDVQYAPLNSMAHKATYSKLVSFGALSALTDISYGNGLLDGASAVQFRTAGEDGVFGATKSLLTDAPTTPVLPVCTAPASKDTAYVQLILTFDDTMRAVARDFASAWLGSQSAVSSLSVTSDSGRAPPDLRMRHGKWFDGQIKQSYDTCNERIDDAPQYVAWTSQTNTANTPGPLNVSLPTDSQGYVAVVTFEDMWTPGYITPPSGWSEVDSYTWSSSDCGVDDRCMTKIYVADKLAPDTSWNWYGNGFIAIGIAGYDVPVMVHEQAHTYNSQTTPSVTTSVPSLLLRVVQDINGNNSDTSYPSSATIGRNQVRNWYAPWGYGLVAAVAHEELDTPGAAGTAAFSIPGADLPRASTLALVRNPAISTEVPEDLEYVGYTYNTAVDTTGPLNVSLPSGSQGYVAIVTYDKDSGSHGFTAPAGWTEIVGDTYSGCATNTCKTSIYVATTKTPGTTWAWSGDTIATAIGVIGYTVPVEAHATGGSLFTATTPSVNVSSVPALILRVVGDVPDSQTPTTYPTGATIGRNQTMAWDAGLGYGSLVAVAHEEKLTTGATGTAAFSIPSSWQPHAYTIALIPAD